MRWRLLAFISLGINLVLAGGWMIYSARQNTVRQPGPHTETLMAGGGAGKTNFVVRRQFFSWREVESPDYGTYIANLRDIGCPEQTIRDIIIADVNAMYSKRLATELLTPEQQWWRSEPDPEIVQVAAGKARELEQERRTLLTTLLGPNWESGDLVNLPRPSKPGVVLDGPVLGALPAETKQALQEVSVRAEQRMQAYLEQQRQAGAEADPAELAKLRQQTRDDLARILPPPQLEEFLLRYSQTADNLRNFFGQLEFFDATPDEFRAVFRATDPIDQRLDLLASGDDLNTAAARKALEDERENAIRLALGPKRYEEYRQLQDPLYREAVAAAEAAGTPEAARIIYQMNLAAAEEYARIQAATNLTAQQKEIEVRQLALDQLKASTLATGQELPPEPPPPPPPRRTYTLRQGDTAAVVALIHGVPVSAIRAANPNINWNRLRPGDSITIPRNALTPEPFNPSR